jgi:hypothetical protein
LSCEMNRIASLDIRENHELESVICNGNGLTSLHISWNNEDLRLIQSSSNRLSSEELDAIFENLPYSGTITIYGNPGTSTCNASIARSKNWIVNAE